MAHIYVRRRRRYTHHGIDCGDGSAIHFVGPRGSVRHVARTPLAMFSAGSVIHVRIYEHHLAADETIQNAQSRLGSVGYHLVRNNCEHFAAWCCTGRSTSSQVRRWVLATQGTLASLVAAQSMGLHVAILGTLRRRTLRDGPPAAPPEMTQNRDNPRNVGLWKCTRHDSARRPDISS